MVTPSDTPASTPPVGTLVPPAQPTTKTNLILKWAGIILVAIAAIWITKLVFFTEKVVPVVTAVAPIKEGPSVQELQVQLAKFEAEAKAKAENDAKAKADAEARVRDRDRELDIQRTETLKVRGLLAAQQAATDAKIAEAKAQAEAEANRLKEEMKTTLPGEARVVFEPFNPNKHHPQKDAFTTEKKFTVEGGPPKFTVKASTDRVRTKEGIINARPVLTKNGQPLLDSGFVPELATSGLKPYKLAVWWESKHDYVNHWFAQ